MKKRIFSILLSVCMVLTMILIQYGTELQATIHMPT